MNLEELLALQKKQGASERLLAHHKTVASIATQIADLLLDKRLDINKPQVIAMAAIHDIGKIKITQELSETGSLHEKVGFEFAKQLGIDEDVAIICLLHGSNNYQPLRFEVLCVILADKLWKGNRIDELENHFIKRASSFAQSDYWAIFSEFDLFFEAIADKGQERLLSMPSV